MTWRIILEKDSCPNLCEGDECDHESNAYGNCKLEHCPRAFIGSE